MRQGYAKPWKVNFAEDRRVANKGEGRAVYAIRKVRPAGDTRQIKEQWRHTVRGKLSHLPKDDSEDERSEKRLEDVPERAQNRLFVLRDEIAPHEHRGEIAIAPQVSEVQIEPSGLRPDHQVPLFGGWCGGFTHGNAEKLKFCFSKIGRSNYERLSCLHCNENR